MIKKIKMHIRNGDTVQIISGKYKGQIGKITQILNKKNQIIVENINIKTKHIRPNQKEESGRIINFEAPIHSSNVMLYSTKYQIRSRYRTLIDEAGDKYRQLHKTKENLK